MRSDHRPRVSDIVYAKSVEDILDVILFLYRDSYYHTPEVGKSEKEAEIIVAKHPNVNQAPVTALWMFDPDRAK